MIQVSDCDIEPRVGQFQSDRFSHPDCPTGNQSHARLIGLSHGYNSTGLRIYSLSKSILKEQHLFCGTIIDTIGGRKSETGQVQVN